ncbi:UvrD-helicase domain-containing protein [Roseburia inulinivorans]
MEQRRQSSGKLPGITREAEEAHLAQTIEITQQNLDKNIAQEQSLKEDIHTLLETYGAKDVEALSLIDNTQLMYETVKRDRSRLEKARKKPYFGRIDFYDEDSKKDEALYIGRVGISKNIIDKVVIDWRAPVASVYYENAVGPCGYTVQNEKTYAIDLLMKRTYEIENDTLKDFYDSDVVANDELLTKYLAKNKKAVLGEIIATIQKEQNEIIRKSPKQNVIVQGSAGSGKTTVAMHRISYILYNYDKEFRPEDFYIIGSNRILLNYITSVLPDLDVYGIRQMTMEQLFTRLLYEDWDEHTMRVHALEKEDSFIHIKGTLFWFQNLEEYCRKLEEETILAEDIFLEVPVKTSSVRRTSSKVTFQKKSKILLTAEAIAAYLNENPEVSIQNKIAMLNKRVMTKVHNEITGKDIRCTADDKREIQKKYRWYFGGKEWKTSIFELYADFLEEQRLKGYQLPVPENDFDVYDLAALAYLYKRVKEIELVREASHVVIDEAQDFGMMVYSVLKFCMRNCTFTIMGDVSQNIHYGYGLNDWEALRKLFLTGPYDSFELLRKSYRNTIEISNFAMRILQHGNFPIYPVEPIIRHGKDVTMAQLSDDKELYHYTAEQVKHWQKEGLETIAIVCRDEKEAEKIKKKLGKKLSVTGDDLENTEFGSGVMILPVAYTKGLEFDAVLLFDPSREKYPSDDAHVKLLYVAATRALHELAVLYKDILTGLIADPVPEREQKVFKVEEKKPVRRVVRKPEVVEKPELSEKPITKPKTIQKSMNLSEHHTSELSGVQSVHKFGDIPDNSILRPSGHGRIDTAVRWVEQTACGVACVSNYGVLHVSPVNDAVIRVTFGAGQKIKELFQNSQTKIKWQQKETREAILINTKEIQLTVDKKSGAISYANAAGKTVLKEKTAPPRQMDVVKKQNWMYFDWSRSERLSAKGVLKDDRLPLKNTTKYICYGEKSKRFPMVHSNLGYGIAVAADSDVLCCNIPMYGPYISTEHMELIDYYFIIGATEADVINRYVEFMNG